LDAETEPGNSSVSDVSEHSPSASQMRWLWDFNMLSDDPDAHTKIVRIVRDWKRENITRRIQEKKETKRASQAQAAAEKAAREKAEAHAASERKRRIIDEAVKNPLQNLPLLLRLMNFYWDRERKFWFNTEHNISLFQNNPSPSPSEDEVLQEIGQNAWDCILEKRFFIAPSVLKKFKEKIEAEDRSSRFSSSLFDSDADDES